MLYFEILHKNKLLRRGVATLNNISFSNELMFVPTLQLELPIDYASYTDDLGEKQDISGREEIKVYINDQLFHGIITALNLNKITETVTFSLGHVISEWENRQLTTNLGVKDKTITELYETDVFKFSPDWNIEFATSTREYMIDYVYSRQNLLAALNKTLELTPDSYWRVNFKKGRHIEVGAFGDKKPYIVSAQPSGSGNIRIINEPRINHRFDHVVNVAIVYGEKSDSGMSSMTLREVFNKVELQDSGFPVVILNEDINNERQYYEYDYPEIAPNNKFEYAILDEESIALESGTIIEGAFSFNDLSPFSIDDFDFETDDEDELIITNDDREKAAIAVYHSAIRRLKQARRYYQIELDVEEMPVDLNVGDRIRFIYDNEMLQLEACSRYMVKVLQKNDWYYITKIDYNIDASGISHSSLTLEKYLRIHRESDLE